MAICYCPPDRLGTCAACKAARNASPDAPFVDHGPRAWPFKHQYACLDCGCNSDDIGKIMHDDNMHCPYCPEDFTIGKNNGAVWYLKRHFTGGPVTVNPNPPSAPPSYPHPFVRDDQAALDDDAQHRAFEGLPAIMMDTKPGPREIDLCGEWPNTHPQPSKVRWCDYETRQVVGSPFEVHVPIAICDWDED